jgi:glucan phosphoethanolaminetransferase (alkaline phosphatase superfamily)
MCRCIRNPALKRRNLSLARRSRGNNITGGSMIEIALAFALSMIVVALSLRLYRSPILLIGSVFIGIASVCVVFVCIPGMMAALKEASQSEHPHALHAYAMIVGLFGLIAVAYYLWDRYRKESGSQDAARLPLDSMKE